VFLTLRWATSQQFIPLNPKYAATYHICVESKFDYVFLINKSARNLPPKDGFPSQNTTRLLVLQPSSIPAGETSGLFEGTTH
jgi:hypothetical protein